MSRFIETPPAAPKPEKKPERTLPKPGEHTPDTLKETPTRPWRK